MVESRIQYRTWWWGVGKRSSKSRMEEGLKLVDFRVYESLYTLISLTIEKENFEV